MKILIATGIAAGVVLLGGCSNGGYGTVGATNTYSGNGNPGGATPPPATQKAASTALYQVNSGLFPYPYDVWFAGSTAGTLNIQPPNPLIPLQSAVNSIDGFSTTAPIRERFNGPVDPVSLATPGAVVMVHISTNNLTKAPVSPLPPANGTFVPLVAGVDYSVGVAADDPTTVEIVPLHPLAASTCLPTPPATVSPCAAANGGNGEGYMVLMTKAITVGGAAAVADADYASFQAALAAGGPTCPSIMDPNLNALCQLSGAHLALAQGVLHINPANVVVSFSFSTVSTLDTMLAAASEASPQPIKVNQTPLTTQTFGGFGLADVYVGVMQLPYYLSKTEPDTEFWHAAAAKAPDKTSTNTTRFNPFPVATQMVQVPVLMTVPNASSGKSKPGTGWPIVIFQHGLTADRTNLLALGDSLASGGFVGIAIDMPLHGCTPPFTTQPACPPLYASSTNPVAQLYAGLGLPASGSIERTFDLKTLSGGAAVDPSGSHYVNLASVLTFRDNIRESSVDLVTLAESVGTILPAGATAPFIDPTQKHYMGHSMGAIVGPGFLAVMPLLMQPILTATLANPGGQFVYLGIESPTFGPPTIKGLEEASNGLLTPGTTPFAQYLRDAQSVIDSADPWNYIVDTVAFTPVHMIEVVGTTPQPAGCNPNTPPAGCTDQVVPNDATERLISTGGLQQLSPPGIFPPGTTPLHAVVKFTDGVHASFLDPTENAAATKEMQTEAVTFAATNGLGLPVGSVPGAPVQ
jgi:hypothetical protein